MKELGLDAEITYIDSYSEIFRALKDGEFDFALCPIQVGNSFLEKLDIQDVFPSYAVSHVYGALALTAGSEELRRRINPLLKDLQMEGRLDELDRKWVNHRYENMTLTGILEKHPWLGVSLLLILFFLVFLLGYILFQRRRTAEKDAHTRQLQENLATIEQQNAQLEARRLELIEAKNRAEAGSRTKTAFLFNMSHDIRTPMNAIIGYTNLAGRGENTPEQMRDYLAKIESSSRHLLSLINDVLEMSRIESGKMELEEADADLCQILPSPASCGAFLRSRAPGPFINSTSCGRGWGCWPQEH